MLQITFVHYKNCYKTVNPKWLPNWKHCTKPVKLSSRFEASPSKCLCLIRLCILSYSGRTLSPANQVLNSCFIGPPIMRYQLMMVLGKNRRVQGLMCVLEQDQKHAKKHGSLNMPLNTELVQKVTNDFNDSLLYSPEEPKMFFSIREPIVNRVLSSSRQRGFSSKVCVRSRCWDACMVVDGGTSFEFNDGAIASIMIDTEDALCTVLLEE
uniref:Uncharacterized protein n=1 Tax=Accipiter nisus TaxID=211598 RepID=A0A8B9NUW1_9AVES